MNRIKTCYFTFCFCGGHWYDGVSVYVLYSFGIIRVVSPQGGTGGLPSGWSPIRVSSVRVVFHHDALPSGRSSIRVISHQGGLLSGWSSIMVVSHQGGLPSGWSLNRAIFHKGILS